MKQNFKQTQPYTSVAHQKHLIQPLLLVVLFSALLAVWKVPQWQVGNIPLRLEEKARIDAETSARVALIQGIGGLLVFVTAGVSWLNLKSTQHNVLIAESKQVTERFSKAVEMLSNENSIYIRLGGIYALERIAKDSAKDHWQVMELLTAFVREKAQLENKQEPFDITDHFAEAAYMSSIEYLDEGYSIEEEWDGITTTPNRDYIYPTSVDIQAILTAIGRRIRTHENGIRHCLDLSRTDLRGVAMTGDLTGINFEGVNLQWAKLQYVDMIGANLTGAGLEGVRFESAILQEVNLENSNLHWTRFTATDLFKANLKGVDFREARFQESNLSQADLTKADFSGASLCRTTRSTLKQANLVRVNFSRVDLSDIDLEGSDLSSTQFEDANLSGANLKRANLSRSRLENANMKLTILVEANLERAILEKANLEEADLQKSNLSDTFITSAIFKGTNFKQANLTKADVSGAHSKLSNMETDFSSALYLTPEQITSMQYWESAIYPSDLEQKLFSSQPESENG